MDGTLFVPNGLVRVVTVYSIWTFRPTVGTGGHYLRLPRVEAPRLVASAPLQDGLWMDYLRITWRGGNKGFWCLAIELVEHPSRVLTTSVILQVRERNV